jgi:hypothetical protein
MTIEGTWDLTIASPGGAQYAALEIVSADGSFEGVAKTSQEELVLKNLVVNHDHVSWSVSITRPLRLNVAFDVTIDGDQMNGHSRVGVFPRSGVVGHRKI